MNDPQPPTTPDRDTLSQGLGTQSTRVQIGDLREWEDVLYIVVDRSDDGQGWIILMDSRVGSFDDLSIFRDSLISRCIIHTPASRSGAAQQDTECPHSPAPTQAQQ